MIEKKGTKKCVTCNGEPAFDKVSNCYVCRKCHPIKAPPMPELSYSLIGLEYCDTKEQAKSLLDKEARKKGWNPEKYICDENVRRFG